MLSQRYFSLCLIFFLGFIAELPALADEFPASFRWKPNLDGEPLGRWLSVYEDKEGLLGLEQIQELDRQGLMKPSREEVPNFGLTTSAMWFRFRLTNSSDRDVVVLLENKFTFVDDFRLYSRDAEGRWVEKRGGDQVAFDGREEKTRQVVFRQTLAPGEHLFYLRSQAIGAHQLPLSIWTPENFHKKNALEYGFIGLLVGAHVVIVFYNLFLFFSLKDPTYLFYVLYVASNLLYQVSGLGLLQQGLSSLGWAETVSNQLMIISVDLVAITALVFSWLFLNLKKRLPSFRKYYLAVISLSSVNIVITSFLSLKIGTDICFLTASGATTVLILSGFLIARQGYLPASFYFVAWGFYLTGVTFTVSNLLGFLPTSEFTRWGQFTGGAFEVAILSLALGARINEKRRAQVERINELNRTLESKVKERTAEIQALLLYIPQGILLIGSRGQVESNYSAQLIEILGHRKIAGQSFWNLLLQPSRLSVDEKDQTWQAILSSLGENALSFEFNQSKLPDQLTYEYEGASKVLRLTWNIEVNEEKLVEHILVTLLDVSAEVQAQAELSRKNQEFEIIRELVEAGAKHAMQFFVAGGQIMEENQRLVESGDLSLDTLKILFMNTHTLKGAARTLHFKELADELHQVESSFVKALRGLGAVDSEQFKADFVRAQAIYDRYQKAQTEVLGRNEDYSRVLVERDFLQKNIDLLQELSAFPGFSLDVRKKISDYREVLSETIFVPLPTTLHEIMGQSAKIAKDLGKDAPILHFEVEDIFISHPQELCLKQAFVHLLRNALDHGIESSEKRLAKEKQKSGRISIKGQCLNGRVVIIFEDDGQGLDLAKLERKGQTLKLIGPQASPEDIAELVFDAGISTAESVSIVSGRGMGMSAVRRFLAAEQGDVSLILGKNGNFESGFCPFQIKLSLPLLFHREESSPVSSDRAS